MPVEDHVQLKNWSVTFAEMLGNFQHNPDRLGGVLDAVENLSRLLPERNRASSESVPARGFFMPS